MFACTGCVHGGADAGNSLVLLVYPAGSLVPKPAPQKQAGVFNVVFACQGGVHGGVGVEVLWCRLRARGVWGGTDLFGWR